MQNDYVDLKNRQYTRSYFASQISHNKKYLAYEGKQRDILKIYDITQGKIVKSIQLDNLLIACQFSIDSSQLYVSCGLGYIYCYDVLHDFKFMFRFSMHQGLILNLRSIKNKYLITCSADNSIRKTDIKRKKLIFQLNGHSQFINAIAYDEESELLISGSSDGSIKFWDCKFRILLINKEQAHLNRIVQLQLINKGQNLLSLDDNGNLFKWQIDLIKNDIFQVQKYSDPYRIYSFCQINQNMNLLLICGLFIKILNDEGETINKIEHKAGLGISLFFFVLDFCATDTIQVDDAQYIHIRSESIKSDDIIDNVSLEIALINEI